MALRGVSRERSPEPGWQVGEPPRGRGPPRRGPDARSRPEAFPGPGAPPLV